MDEKRSDLIADIDIARQELAPVQFLHQAVSMGRAFGQQEQQARLQKPPDGRFHERAPAVSPVAEQPPKSMMHAGSHLFTQYNLPSVSVDICQLHISCTNITSDPASCQEGRPESIHIH